MIMYLKSNQLHSSFTFFFFNDPAPTEIYTLPLHDALPISLWRELSRMSGADAARLRDRVQETTGLDLEKDLIPSFAGNVGVPVYLDATSLIEAIMGEEVGSFDRSAFLMAAQLANPASGQSALHRSMKTRPAADRAKLDAARALHRRPAAPAAVH